MACEVKVKKLHPEAVVPRYAKPGDAGFDLHAIRDVTIYPGETAVVWTGLAIELPWGYEMQVRPRSGLSASTPLLIQNTPGTIDAGYRGQIGIICHCLYTPSHTKVDIKAGDRIAQGVIAEGTTAYFIETDELSETVRGTGGLGSTGV